jgi:hypothetical protein
MSKSKLETRIEEGSKKLEESAEQAAERFELGFINWVKNDRFFDGFRNTYGRILLIVLAAIWLVGGLLYCYNNESGFFIYAIGVGLSVLAQKISVRFVFSTSDLKLADEYQEARRNRAYRRAYTWVTQIVTGLVAVVLFYAYVNVYFTDGYIPLIPDAFIDWNLGAYQVATILVFFMGLFSLIPHFAWGFKGEPFRSKNEPNE